MSDRVAIAPIRRYEGGAWSVDHDLVAVESPLRLELTQRSRETGRSLGMLMRTPGDDADLALGFLYTEGIIRSRDDVEAIEERADENAAEGPMAVLTAVLAGRIDLPALDVDRAGLMTSACGICGRLALRALDAARPARSDNGIPLDPAIIASLPDRLRAGQAVFSETGGLHAAALVCADGGVVCLREDVGRHNAVDKVIGAALDAGSLSADAILAVSGRAAFEIVQKAAMAGLRTIVAVGAPSSLAVDAARSTGITLIGFARDGRFNVYVGAVAD